jgi:hypothetical protein
MKGKIIDVGCVNISGNVKEYKTEYGILGCEG